MADSIMNNPVANNLSNGNSLDQLRPIILPDYDVSLWPLAIGWWFLLGIAALLISGFFILRPILKARRENKQLLQNTLSLLDSLHAECAQQTDKPKALQHYLQKSNDVFKRVVHANKYLAPFAQLTGPQWINLVVKINPDSPFANYYGDHLYAARCNEDINLKNLHDWACEWVKQADKNAKKIAREFTR